MPRKPHKRRYCRCTAPIQADGQCLYRCPPNPGAAARNKPAGVRPKPAGLPTHSEVSAAFKRTGLHKPYESQPFTEKAAIAWRKRQKAQRRNPMSNNPKPYTYAELLEDLRQLTPEQLAHPVKWFGDERGGAIARLDITEEDHVRIDDVAEPISVFLNGDGSLTKEGEDLDMTPVEIRKRVCAVVGQPFLAEP